MLFAQISLLALLPAAAFAQCQGEPVPTPNPSDVINIISRAQSNSQSLHALLVADDSFSVGNPLDYHVLRRENEAWTDLGGPGAGALSGQPSFFAMHAEDTGRVWLGGVSDEGHVNQNPPIVASWDGAWSDPYEIDLRNQVMYPFYDRGGKIRAMDIAPDGVMFAVGWALNYGLTDDNSVPLFLVNYGSGWIEKTLVETDWPGNFSSETMLNDVIAFSSDNVWAVGQHAPQNDGFARGGLIVHWDGASLTILDDPRAGGDLIGHPLRAMDASGPDDIWAVGGNVFDPMTSTIAHYDGERWSRIESPVPLPLGSIALGEDGTGWAASYNQGSDNAYFDGEHWSAVAPAIADASIQTISRDPDGAVWLLGAFEQTMSFAQKIDCACGADLDMDGSMTYFDVTVFLDLFMAGDPAVDFDGDGLLTFFDVHDFLVSFGAGCV